MTGDDVLHKVFSALEKSSSEFPTLVQPDRQADS